MNFKLRHYPSGIYFDYIDEGIRSGVYDLDKVSEILKKRSDITFVGENGRSYGRDPSEPHLIPYYNNTSGKEKMLSFYFMPSQEQMELIYKEQTKEKKSLVVLRHDMLGIACAKHDQEIEFEDDDD